MVYLQRQSSEEIKQNRELRKPKIVNEVFKPPPPNNNSKQNNSNQHKILNRNNEGPKSIEYLEEFKTKRVDQKQIGQELKFTEKAEIIDMKSDDISKQDNAVTNTLLDDEINKICDETVHKNHNGLETKSKHKNDPLTLNNEIDSVNQREVNKKHTKGESEIEIRKLNVNDRVRNMQSKEETRRSKSLADVEIGDVIKGNVNEILYRIKSRENLNYGGNKEVINAKERPRKKSVLEKIALFEVSVA